jgi:hypothetical protein
MAIKLRTTVLAAAATAAAALAPTAAVAAEPTVNWQINLKPSAAYPRAAGGAQYQSRPGQRELQVEVEHILALKGKTITACVNGAALGSATVSRLGLADVSRNTELRQTVPVVVHGTNVSVSLGSTCAGPTIVQGTF